MSTVIKLQATFYEAIHKIQPQNKLAVFSLLNKYTFSDPVKYLWASN